MPEQLKPSNLQSHAQTLREQAGRRLSRSPHPYHRQQFELPHASERFSTNAPSQKSPLRSAQNTDDEGQDGARYSPERYREFTNSDSGTEADDEHFLKGLPAPKLRLHKGLRNADGSLSSTPSPLLSPVILDEELHKSHGYLQRAAVTSASLTEDGVRKAAERFRQKRRVEVVRRTTETALLVLVGGVLCLNREVRQLLRFWGRELFCQCLVISTLVAMYPLRLLHYLSPSQPWKRPLPLTLPVAFDPAPLLYPPVLTIFVPLLLSINNPIGVLPNIILAISSLPKELIPAVGGLDGANTLHWLLSLLPILLSKRTISGHAILIIQPKNVELDSEDLVLLPPLHQALSVTLHSLTTTSLLPAELQLLSIALIDLLLLASSPQAIILKALLWGGGIGILVTCERVLRWGVALARVPKWRFRRPANLGRSPNQKGLKLAWKPFSFGNLGTSVFARDAVLSESDEDEFDQPATHEPSPKLKLSTRDNTSPIERMEENGSISALEPQSGVKFTFPNGSAQADSEVSSFVQRRHTLPSLTSLPPRSSKRTPSGRRKRSGSSSVQSFFSLTQTQAILRKWLYALYVYVWVLIIILVGIRKYVGRFALQENEPIGWALGYLFGDLPWFRIEVVTANLQRWICLPPRSGLENDESCHLGWVEHLRHASFGEANSRLILCTYWLGIIIVGLAIVLRLSAVYEVDTRRKVFHFMMVAMLLPATYVDPTFAAMALSLMLAIFLLLDLFRASQLPPLSKSLAYFLTPYVDGRDLKGPVVISHIFLLIGCAIPLWLSLGSLSRTGKGYLAGWEVPSREVSMVSGVICVGMGDAAASLVGRRYGRRKWVWGGGKSIEGSVAFATAVGLALILAKAWLRIGGWPAKNADLWVMTLGKAGVAACVASLTEAVLTGGNDNVVVPVVLWLCVKGLDI